MNLRKITHWANKILKIFQREKKSDTQSRSKFQKICKDLANQQTFITKLNTELEILSDFEKTLKNQGLSWNTWKKSRKIILKLPESSTIRKECLGWLNEHLEVASSSSLASLGLPVSTDSLESLFSYFKGQGTPQCKDPIRGALKLVAFGEELTWDDIDSVLQMPQKELNSSRYPIPPQESTEGFKWGNGACGAGKTE